MKRTQKKNFFHWKILSIAFLLLAFVAVSCDQSPLYPDNPHGNDGNDGHSGSVKALGLVEITISGIGSGHMTASARTAVPDVAADFSNIPEGDIEYEVMSTGSFTLGKRPTEPTNIKGYRYINAIYRVKNMDDQSLQNLTFLAVNTNNTYDHTTVANLTTFGGKEPDHAERIAENIKPTGRVALSSSGDLLSLYPDVLQVFTENEVHTFEQNISNSDVKDIFPWGFMVHTPSVTPGSRTLKPTGQYNGRVTFSFKVPLQTRANQDPFKITMMFLMVEDSQTRITRSIQEAKYGGRNAFRQRVTELTAGIVTLLGSTPYSGSRPARTLCGARVAGTNEKPVTTLSAGSGCSADPIPPIYYVDADAPAGGNGLSWDHAFSSLQKALAKAEPGYEVWVAEGTYYPDVGGTYANNDRNATFKLESGVEIYGGFAPGKGANTFAERNWQKYETVLSGDLMQNDGSNFTNYGDNAYHAVTGRYFKNNSASPSAVLNGFTITAGYASSGKGGGIFLNHSSLKLINMKITKNKAAKEGGGIYNKLSHLLLKNVTISGNMAKRGGGLYYNFGHGSNSKLVNVIIKNNKAKKAGGGMYNFESSPILKNVIIKGNTAINRDGGGIFNTYGSSPLLKNVTISNNTATNGGGMCNQQNSNPILINVTIRNNTARRNGGGIYNASSSPVLTNVLIIGNQASGGAGIYIDHSSPVLINVTISNNTGTGRGSAIVYWNDSKPVIKNTIMWGNSSPAIGSFSFEGSSEIHIRYSILESGCPPNEGNYNTVSCTNIITQNPDFITPGSNYMLQSSSPAINAGKNTFLPKDTYDLDGDGNTKEPIPVDLAGNDRTVGSSVDLGAYEFQGQ